MSNILENKMIKQLLDKAPENVREMLNEVLSDDKLSLSDKIKKLQSSIEDNENYEKAKKASGFFKKKWFTGQK